MSTNSQDNYFHRDASNELQLIVTRTAEIQGAFFLPYLRAGMRLLDCGCGPGTITAGLAKIVAPGEVAAIDNGPEQIEMARNHANENNISNITFRVASVYEIPFPDESFNAVFIHNVLEHLQEPESALKEAYRVLKPGGFIGVRDVETAGLIFEPNNPLLEKWLEVYTRVWESNSGSPRMGKRLRALLRQTGFANVRATASYDSYGTPEALKWLCGLMANRFISDPDLANKALELGLADQPTLEKLASACIELGNDPDGFMANAHCEAVGWKE